MARFHVKFAALTPLLLPLGVVQGIDERNGRLVRSASMPLDLDGHGSVADITANGATQWLTDHRPHDIPQLADPIRYDVALDRQHAEEAVANRQSYPWAQAVPRAIFEEWVLPYTHFDERPEAWRATFAGKLSPLLRKDMSLRDAATSIQQGIWTSFGEPAIVFKHNQTPQVLSPSDVFAKRYGSCTGLSIFLVDGLRSCGIPARVVGIAEWNRPEKGNHNWVEVWFDDKWNFIDPAPGPATWNQAWFVADAKNAIPNGLHGIYTPVIWTPAQADAVYTVTWTDKPLELPAIELTATYQARGHEGA